RHLRLARHLDALPVHVELQAVIAAGQMVAGHLAHRQRRGAMTAAVLQRADRATGGAEQYDLVIEKGLGDRLVGELVRPQRGVPAVAQEHSWSPSGACASAAADALR